jgi:glucose-6-phosphate 1-dehydrogenase
MKADALVLFGATGDLARKKLFPALYDLEDLGELDVPIIGVASSKWSQEDFRQNAEKAVRARKPEVDEAALGKLKRPLFNWQRQSKISNFRLSIWPLHQNTFQRLQIN